MAEKTIIKNMGAILVGIVSSLLVLVCLEFSAGLFEAEDFAYDVKYPDVYYLSIQEDEGDVDKINMSKLY